MSKSEQIMQRAIKAGEIMTETKCTVRDIAKVLGVSKSTVHADIAVRLEKYGKYDLALEAHNVLMENKATRNVRGGEATKKKFKQLKGEK